MHETPSRPERTDDVAALFARFERLAQQQLQAIHELKRCALDLYDLAAAESVRLAQRE